MSGALKIVGTPQEPAGRESAYLIVARRNTDGTYQPLISNAAGELIVTTGGGGGIQYTEGDVDVSITGTAAMWEDSGDTLRAVSASKPLPVGPPGDLTASGTLTAAGQDVTLALSGRQGVAIQVTGIFAMTLLVEASIDGGITWVGIRVLTSPVQNWVIVLDTAGNFLVPYTLGFSHIRVRVTAFTSGSASIFIRATLYPVAGNVFAGSQLSASPPAVAVIGGEDTGLFLIERLRMTTLDPDAASDVGAIVRDPRTGDLYKKVTGTAGANPPATNYQSVRITDGTVFGGRTVTTADGLVTAPAANALIAEVVSLAAGDYEVYIHMGCDDTQLKGRYLLAVWTDSTDVVKDNLSLIPAPGFGTFYVPRLTVVLNDKIRILAGNVAADTATRYQGHISVRTNA